MFCSRSSMSRTRTGAVRRNSSGGGSSSRSGSGVSSKEDMRKMYGVETNSRNDCERSGRCKALFSNNSRRDIGSSGRSSPDVRMGGRTGGSSRSGRAHTRTFLGALSAFSGELVDRYWVGEVLGTGRFGVVRKVMEKTTGRIYACKTMDRRRVMAEPAAVENLEMELFALAALPAHPSLLRLASVHVQGPHPQADYAPPSSSAGVGLDGEEDEGEGFIHIVMELCEGGDLYEAIEAAVAAAGSALDVSDAYPRLSSPAPSRPDVDICGHSNCTPHLPGSSGGSEGDYGGMEEVTMDVRVISSFCCLPPLVERGACAGGEATYLDSPDSCTSASSFSSTSNGSSNGNRGGSTTAATTATNCSGHESSNTSNDTSLSGRTSRFEIDRSRKALEQADADIPDMGYSEALEVCRRQPAMPEWMCAWVIHQTASALSHCHRLGLVHRDVKPENIFLAKAVRPGSPTAPGSQELHGSCFSDLPLSALPEVRLGDFGQAVLVLPGEHVSGRAGSIPYMAPEVYAREWYDSSADIWSLGITLYAMLSGSLPFSEPPVLAQSVAQANLMDTTLSSSSSSSSLAHGTFHSGPSYASLSLLPDLVSDPWPSVLLSAQHLISWMLCANPQHRPTARQVLAHPWFQEAMEGF